MAARLEVKSDGVWLGKIRVAQWIFKGASTVVGYRIDGVWRAEDPVYEEPVDAIDDCESEVRRLLKEAGCEVET